MRERLQGRCEELGVPCVAVLDPIIRSLSSYLGLTAKGVPGLQHAMDDAYFKRVAAIDFAMRYDDGKDMQGLREAEVILIGVSRTSKTPTSVFLARRGIKCANIPLVPGVPIDEEKLTLEAPFYVGLTASPKRLMQIRRNRIAAGKHHEKAIEANTYLDEEKIEEEVRNARKMFTRHGWPVIDVTKRSVEETAAEIMALLQSRTEKQNKKERHEA
jgi:regulator of PEP synthase PpsR (kinase-PPPase family)